MSFALRLKELREKKGLSQAQLARALNVGVGSVGMWESTQRTPPAKRLQDIASFFGVTIDYLLSNEDFIEDDTSEKALIKIKELRKNAGLTQLQFCQKFNITQSTLSGWETGRWQPDNETLIKLATFFGVSVDYLLGREQNKNLIERPPYEITDKQLLDFMKLYEYLTELQKAQIFGYIVAILEQSGVNVESVLRG